MDRRKFAKITAAGSLAISPALSTLTRLFSMDEYNMQPLRGSVGYFTERGGTIVWMIEDGAVVVVDTQFPDQSMHLIEAIAERTSTPVDLVINTHHHGDHTAGNIAYKGIAKNIVAHENSKANQLRNAEEKNNLDKILLPDVTFSKKWSQGIGSETISARYFGAGHTNGDAFIHFENANVVHVGDLVFNRRFPYIDKGAGASIENWISVLDKARKHYDDDTIFVCGHAAEGYDIVITKDDISAFGAYLENVLEFVTSELKAGKSEKEIHLAESIPGSPEWKGKGIARSLSAAIIELQEGK